MKEIQLINIEKELRKIQRRSRKRVHINEGVLYWIKSLGVLAFLIGAWFLCAWIEVMLP